MDIMISEKIVQVNQTLEERGLPPESYFEVEFEDGSKVSELNANWSSFATKKTVDYFGQNRAFFFCNYPVKSITIKLNGMEAKIENIEAGVEVYQYMRSERILAREVDKNSIIGRGIGIAKDGAVIEEQFINALENRVQGMRK